MDDTVKKWRKAGKHLPKFMRDFHDQKDLFKAVSELTEHKINNMVSWVDAHIYTIDVFLWFMARHGYTLQKTRKRAIFEDVEKNIEYCRVQRSERFSTMICCTKTSTNSPTK